MSDASKIDSFMQACESQEKDWLAKKKEYEELKERYKELADKGSENFPSQISKVGYLRVNIPQVRKVTVLLGDNWFAERTVPQAIEIANRRIQHFDSCLKTFREERKNALRLVSDHKSNMNLNKTAITATDDNKKTNREVKTSTHTDEDRHIRPKGERRIAHKPKSDSTENSAPKAVPTSNVIPLNSDGGSQVEIREELNVQDFKNDWRMRMKGERRVAHQPKHVDKTLAAGQKIDSLETLPSSESAKPVQSARIDIKSVITTKLAQLQLEDTNLDSDDDEGVRTNPTVTENATSLSEGDSDKSASSFPRRKSVTWADTPAESRQIVTEDKEFNGCLPNSILKKRPAEISIDWSDPSLLPPPERKIVETSYATFTGNIEEKGTCHQENLAPEKPSRPKSRFKQSRQKKAIP